MELIIKKDDIHFLENKGLVVKGKEEEVWNELSKRCSHNVVAHNSVKYENPPKISGLFRCLPSEKTTDICIAFSKMNGIDTTRLIADKLRSKNLTVSFATDLDPNSNLDLPSLEKRVATAHSLVVLLTSDCLKQMEVVSAMAAGQQYMQHISQVHDAGSCLFPGYDEQPPSLGEIFSEKAITFLRCYADVGIAQIVEKYQAEKKIAEQQQNEKKRAASDSFTKILSLYEKADGLSTNQFRSAFQGVIPEQELDDIVKELDKNSDGQIDMSEFCDMFLRSTKFAKLIKKLDQEEQQEEHETEDIHTRVFLSHKRTTGQAVAGRLYEGLKTSYKVFLDSEAKFKIHNLKLIVENTEHFVFILSAGIFQSKWCLEELKSAVANKKKVTIIRELSFILPDTIPAEWQQFEAMFRDPNQLIWMAEYNKPCIEALCKHIGVPDHPMMGAAEVVRNMKKPNQLAKFKQEGKLVISPLTLCALKQKFQQEFGEDFQQYVKHLEIKGSIFATDMEWWRDYKLKFPNIQYFNSETFTPVANDIIEWIGNKELKGIRLNSNYPVKWDRFIANFPKLESVEVAQDNVPETVLPLLINTYHSTLKRLSVDSSLDVSSLEGEVLDDLASKCKHLEYLEFNFFDLPAFNETFHALKTLVVVNDDGCPDFFASFPQHCPNLEVLSLKADEDSSITAEVLKNIGTHCKKLRELTIAGKHFTNEAAGMVSQHFPNLKILDLDVRSSPEFTDEAMKHLSSLALHTFKITYAPMVTNQGIFNLKPLLQNLKHLEIRYLAGVTEPGYSFIFQNACSLEHFSMLAKELKSFPQVQLAFANTIKTFYSYESIWRDNCMKYLAACTSLEKLGLGTTNVTDDGIAQLAPLIPNLKELRLPDCFLFTRKSIDMIIDLGQKYEVLSLGNCKQSNLMLPNQQTPGEISDHYGAKIKQKFPNINSGYVVVFKDV